MSAEIPLPGAERDAEIARAILSYEKQREMCWCTAHYVVYRVTGSECRTCGKTLPPRYSTDPAACDRLEAELDRRGYEVHVSRIAGYCNVFVRRGADELTAAIANCRPDAVSAAALVALRASR